METKHHRRSVRLQAYDYGQPGAYYVTMVAAERACAFGHIDGREMVLSPRGQVAQECWCAIPAHLQSVELGAYVVMPNHVHGIIVLRERAGESPARRGTPWRAPTLPSRVSAITRHAPTSPMITPADIEQFGHPASGSLATIIRQYKSSVVRIVVQQFGGAPRIWQRNYYEHVIRDDDDWKRITAYIEANPMNWQSDEEFA